MQSDSSDAAEPSVASLCDQLRLVDRADRTEAVDAWLGDAGAAMADTADMRLTLLEAGAAIATMLCRQEPPAACRCDHVAWSAVTLITTDGTDPRHAFRSFAAALFAQIARDHPESPADRAAAMIRRSPERRWQTKTLAAQVRTRPRRLCATFTRRFGISVADYVHATRMARALRIVDRSQKTAALASDLGYRSKKDCYAAMDRWLGVTPGRLRAWSPEKRHAVALQFEAWLRHGTDAGTLPATTQRRRCRRLARTIKSANVPATSAAPPTRATPA